MSSATVQEVRKSLLKLAQSWPKDPLRPNLDFGEAIRTAAESELANVARGKVNAAELRQSLASLERLRGSECLREVRYNHSPTSTLPHAIYCNLHLLRNIIPS